AVRLCSILMQDYPDRLAERYKIKDFADCEAWEVLEMIGKKRGMLISGGEVDTERAAIMLLDELRAGRLGKITFERPAGGVL
ncbi:MAG: ribosome biogenesis GTPase YlqF, partial [Clostridia bacterium]|nr:ribosome biogenesis GTPase YlqF [Clostridia bacterium]